MLKGALGKILYGALFVVALPAALLGWVHATADIVNVPVPEAKSAGAVFAGLGVLLVLGGWHALYRQGGGLPMNAFPPPRYVTRGVYAVVAHPIYVGACVFCFGLSLAVGSSGGFWLASPAMVLASTALVFGYERQDLQARFGDVGARPWLSLAPDDDAPPTLAERLALYPMVILLWGALYEAVAAAGVPRDAISTVTRFEATVPVIEQTEAIYALTYPFVLLAPFMARARRDLRAFAVFGLVASALIFPLYLALPLVSPPRPFMPAGALGHVLALERALDTPTCAFPSFHVVWAFIAANAWASRFPRAKIALSMFALAVAASCFTTGMHSLADIAGGIVAYVAVSRRLVLWGALRAVTERIANSWYEVRFGGVRVINHGGWAALSTFGGFAIVGTLVGPGHVLSIFVAGLAGIVGAALWAQIIEGSPSLLRPYGFYGGMLGITIGCIAAPLTGTSTWLLLSAFCVAGPWIQAAGRVRCLVQGCCHGHEAPPVIGIRYTHPRSRVVRLSTLGGTPVHPTPLYSILWNVVIALVVGRLWSLHAPLHFIGGIYLMLNGFGRFVEEAYRGEPQTPVYARLRFYQWVALGTVLLGVMITAVLSSAPAPSPEPNVTSVVVAVVFGLLMGFGAGVDFPDSNRRFARLV
ncbi:Prolipoprotein diacylglyceryl transferase [Minicystis rosea]|nr:Prolipoprotein diacylglyceryl transferase [Minicystis rosea]